VPAIPAIDARLAAALAKMRPFEPPTGLADRQWALAEVGQNYLIYSMMGGAIRLDLSGDATTFSTWWIDPVTGRASAAGEIAGGDVRRFDSPSGGRSVLWLTRK
jgi:hypothetical protein